MTDIRPVSVAVIRAVDELDDPDDLYRLADRLRVIADFVTDVAESRRLAGEAGR